ncbi:bacteriocin immunity protein [Enterococcus alishanensis]
MSEEKVTAMMNNLSVAYGDEEMKKYPEIQKMLLDSAKELEKSGDSKLIAARLSYDIPKYFLGHKNDCPKALITLYYQIASDANKYKGVALSAMMLPLWF